MARFAAPSFGRREFLGSRFILLTSVRLGFVDLAVNFTRSEELIVRAHVRNMAVVHHENEGGILHGRARWAMMIFVVSGI